jgi:hypothetical protein
MTPKFFSPRTAPVVFLIACLFWLNLHPVAANAATRQAHIPKALHSQAASQGSATWQLPFGSNPKLAHDYAAQLTPYGKGHRGMDYLVKDGSELLAPSDGVIAYVGLVALKPEISIAHSAGYRTSYEQACTDLAVGTKVSKGQLFGKVCTVADLIPNLKKNPVVVAAGPAVRAAATAIAVTKAVLKAINLQSHCRPRLCIHISLRHSGSYLSPLALIGGLKPSRLVK